MSESDRMQMVTALKDRLETSPFGDRGSMIDETAETLGLSRNSIYRDLRKVGWRSQRKLRSDKNDTQVTEDQLEFLANVLRESTRATGKRLLSMRRVAEIARANGKLDVDLSDATLMRILRRAGLHPDQLATPTPHVEMRTRHPNHVWQFDVSTCVLFYLDTGGLGVMDKDRFYKNKPDNIRKVSKQRVQRYLVTDHCTGAFFVRYYLAPGEDQGTLFQFFMEAFHERKDQLLHGVPFQLVWDAGSANQSHAIKHMLDALDTQHAAHMPGNPRAKGQVERTHDLIECDFEGALMLIKVEDIDHLNRVADSWQVHYNATQIHSRHGHTRYGAWQMIRAEQLRKCPAIEICRSLMFSRPESRTIKGNLTIQYAVKGYQSAFYSVAHVPNVRVGEAIQVTVNPYRAPNIFAVFEDAEGQTVRCECLPIARDQFGFAYHAPIFGESYQSAPDTATDRSRKAMEKHAYGADTQMDVQKARKEKRPAFNGEIDPYTYLEDAPKPEFIRRPGTDLHVPNSVQIELTPLDHIAVMKALRGRLHRAVSAEENALIRQWYPGGVPEDEFEVLFERLTAGDGPALTVVK